MPITSTTTASLTEASKLRIVELWNGAYPARLAYSSLQDFEEYLAGLADAQHTLLTDEVGRIVGWYVDFVRSGERWFAIIVDAEWQGKGVGDRLLTQAKQQHTCLNGWVIDHDNDRRLDGLPYRSPLAFYLKHGFAVLPDERLELAHISAVKIRWERPVTT